MAKVEQGGRSGGRSEDGSAVQIIELHSMSDFTHKTSSSVPVGEPLFQPSHSSIEFYEYEPFKHNEITLRLRNRDAVARRVKILQPESEMFSVSHRGKRPPGDKVASGMELSFTVVFTPDCITACSTELVVVTEREKFSIPVYSRGREPLLQLPTALEFEPTAVLMQSTKTRHICNVGSARARVQLVCSGAFSAEPAAATLAENDSLPVTFSFKPSTVEAHEGYLRFLFDDGKSQYMHLSGVGRELDVGFEQSVLQMPNTFVNTTSRKALRLVNNSDIVVPFSMKRFATEEEDETARVAAIERIQQDHHLQHNHEQYCTDENSSTGEQYAYTKSLYRSQGAAQTEHDALVARVLEDEVLFEHEAIEVEPLKGHVMPRSATDIVVRFTPTQPQKLEHAVSCEIAGQAHRLPLVVRGHGVGPKIMFSYDVMDLGVCYIHAKHQCELEIRNRGDIAADFHMASSTSLEDLPQQQMRRVSHDGISFQFEPCSGTLHAGDSVAIQVTFTGWKLGAFREVFNCDISGASEPLYIEFRGSVAGPSFQLNPEPVDFGSCALGFHYQREVSLCNTSEIPMRYRIRMPDANEEEFDVDPQEGSLLPGGQLDLQIGFTPSTVRTFSTPLVVDIIGVGLAMKYIDIQADCLASDVKLNDTILDFGTTYLRAHYSKSVTLVNESTLPARYEISQNDNISKGLAVYTADPSQGTVPAHGSVDVPFTLSTERLGTINLPVDIHVPGCSRSPLRFTIQARSCGPDICVSESSGDTSSKKDVSSLDFGRIKCLRKHEKTLYVTNTCPVSTRVHAVVAGKDSSFEINTNELSLEAGEQKAVRVTALLEGATRVQDSLYFLVSEGSERTISLRAIGTGTALEADEDITTINFGTVFRCSSFERSFTIANMGRKTQTLVWSHAEADGRSRNRSGNGPPASSQENATHDLENAVSISPQRVHIAPGEEQQFIVSGTSTQSREIDEELIGSVSLGRSTQVVMRSNCRASVVPVSLQMTTRQLVFQYAYVPDNPPHSIEKPLGLRNASPLRMSFALRAPYPFALDATEFTLDPGEECNCKCNFDAGFTSSRESTTEQGKITVSFIGTEVVDHIDLLGYLNFPNLQLSDTSVSFGAVLNETTARRAMFMKNISTVPAHYSWMLHDDHSSVTARGRQLVGSVDGGSQASMSVPHVNASQAFSILPATGILQPGEHQWLEVSFYAFRGIRTQLTATCNVEGGPQYGLNLSAESSSIRYSVDSDNLDFGRALYNRTLEKEVVITNSGRVPFTFSVDLTSLLRPTNVMVSPSESRLEAGEKQSLRIRFCPGIPDTVHEVIALEVAYLKPQKIRLSAEGLTPLLSLSLPRLADDSREAKVSHAKQLINAFGIRLPLPTKKIGASGTPTAQTARTGTSTARSGSRQRSGRHSGSDRSTQEDVVIESKANLAYAAELEADRLTLYDSVCRFESSSADLTEIETEGSPCFAQYVCDFGHVVKGTTRTRRFKVTNISELQLTARMEKKMLEDCGITVEPDTFKKLQGVPEFESAEMTATLNTAGVSAGELNIKTGLRLRQGPHAEITFKGSIDVPFVEVSDLVLDFGNVLTGHLKRVYFQLHNPCPVAADWSIQRPSSRNEAKDWQFFHLSARSGHLAPGQRKNIFADFSPPPLESCSYRDFFEQKLPLKVSYGSATSTVICKAVAGRIDIECDTDQLHLGAVLPGSKDPNESLFAIENKCDAAVEVYSVDYDKQYRVDEEMLRAYEGFDSNGVALLAPREPGDSIWSEVAEAHRLREEQQQQQQQEGSPPNADSSASEHEHLQRQVSSIDVASGEVSDAKPSSTQSKEEKEEPPDKTCLNIVLFGPPCAGTTTQALRLSERYGIPVVNMDEAIAAACSERSELSNRIRKNIGYEQLALDTDQHHNENQVYANTLPLGNFVGEDALIEALQRRFSREDAKSGAVMDHTRSKVAPADVAARAVLQAFGLRKETKEAVSHEGQGNKKQQQLQQQQRSVSKKESSQRQKKVEMPPEGISWVGDTEVHVFHLNIAQDLAQERWKRQWNESYGSEAIGEEEVFSETDFGHDAEQAKLGFGSYPVRTIEASQSTEQVLKEICKTTPEYPGKKDEVPDPELYEVVTKPAKRNARLPPSGLRLLTPKDQNSAAQMLYEAKNSTDQRHANQAERTPKRKFKPEEVLEQSRWQIPARSRVILLARYAPEEVGDVECSLAFESKGAHASTHVAVIGTCAYPTISNDVRDVFYRRTRSNASGISVAKQFVVPRSRFEFGPLLIGKKKANEKQTSRVEDLPEHHRSNIARLCMRNNGYFLAKCKLSLRNEDGSNTNAFAIEPQEITLDIQESQEVIVRCYPQEEGTHEASLVVQIENNPQAVEFKLSSIGVKPALSMDTTRINFGRLLLGHNGVKEATVRNSTSLPLKWNLKGVEQLHEDLSVSNSGGTIDPHTEHKLIFKFSASTEGVHEKELVLEGRDCDDVVTMQQQSKLALKAEAYNMAIDIQYPDGASGLDFGLIKALEPSIKSFTVQNKGKYEVGFQIVFKNSSMRDLLTFNPDNGSIASGATQTIEVVFNKYMTIKREVSLVGNTDTMLNISEPLTGNKERSFTLKLDVRSILSKYAIVPARGLHFGPHVYNTTSAPRYISISNTGESTFDVKLFNYGNESSEKTEIEAEQVAAPVESKEWNKERKGTSKEKSSKNSSGSKKQDKSKEAKPLNLGNFHLTPQTASVSPGSSLDVCTIFTAESQRTFTEILGIEISDRDPNDCPGGIPYELSAESCIPGINSEDLDLIFEEHKVISYLNPLHPEPHCFARAERTFNFGPVLACFEQQQKQLNPTEARFRISNPNKVAATVRFSMKPRSPQETPADSFPMDVEPRKVDIPEHEHRYVTVSFLPRSIQTFVGTFEANVEGGVDPKTKSFTCDVRGDGALPQISLKDSHGAGEQSDACSLRLPRAMPGHHKSHKVFVCNHGLLPAHTRIVLETSSQAFTVNGGSHALRVEPAEQLPLSIEFHPEAKGYYEAEISFTVRDNPFDVRRVNVQAECYDEDLVLSGLPGEYDDELHFEDTAIGEDREISFLLQNLSSTLYRFEIPEVDSLSFAPHKGHVPSKTYKRLRARFSPSSAMKHKGTEIKMELAGIEAKYEGLDAWDSLSDYDEPEHSRTSDGRTLSLKVYAVADNSRFEVDEQPIVFRPTMMFQRRSYAIALRNSSAATLNFTCRLLNPALHDNEDVGPYEVQPTNAQLGEGESTSVTVRFAPFEVINCKRVLSIEAPHLDSGYKPAQIELDGTVLRPWCHFDFAESDYVTSGRRDPSLPGPNGEVPAPIDASTKVVEIDSLGTRARNVKRFFVLNPTNIAYDFEWKALDDNAVGSVSGPFRVPYNSGTIGGGKNYEMMVEYIPQSDGLSESFWIFNIPEQQIRVPFLFVGKVREPDVKLEQVAINFSQVLVGASAREIVNLVNNEDAPFTFAFDQATIDASGVVSICPQSATVQPNSKLEIGVTFTPGAEESYNFNATLNVQRKPSRLALNIKGSGYAIHDHVELDTPEGKAIPISSDEAIELDLGKLFVNEKCRRKLRVANGGNLPFECRSDDNDNPYVSLEPNRMSIAQGERQTLELTYHPLKQETLSRYPVSISVINGSKYNFRLLAEAKKPQLYFSKKHINFGRSLIYQEGIDAQQITVQLTNCEAQDLSYDIPFDDLPHLQVKPKAGVLTPGEIRDVTFTFTPSAEKEYSERVPVEVNGLYSVPVTVTGEGTPLRLELADSSLRTLNLGSLRPGQRNSQDVRLVNRSKLPVELSLLPSKDELNKLCIQTYPHDRLLLKAKQTGALTFTYQPKARMRRFEHDVVASVNGVRMQLLHLQGACLGLQASVASESLPFGKVVLGSKLTKRVQLQNTGDVGTTFKWSTDSFKPHFTPSPVDGYIAPGSDATTDIVFEPTALSDDISATGRVTFGAIGEQTVTMTGSCVSAEAESAPIEFRVPVRQTTSKPITLTNDTNVDWNITPSANNALWSGPERIEVPAGQSKQYMLTFAPTSMAGEDDPHVGTVFFPRPDGKAVVYNLRGIAESPAPERSLQRTVAAKSSYTESLEVRNWLARVQRFKVTVQLSSQSDPTAKFDGAEYVDVPSLSSREYKLRFLSYKEGTVDAWVYFTEQALGEYLVFKLKFDVQAPTSLDTVPLHCPVRQKAVSEVTVDNPLDQQTQLACSADHMQVFPREKVDVPPRSSAKVPVAYRPVLPGEKDATLTAVSHELGKFVFTLKLSATPPGPERALTFTVPLGSKQTLPFKFTHYLQKKAEYSCSFSSKGEAGFECDRSVVAHPAGINGVPVEMEVTFEPTAVGDNFRDTLVVSASEAGEYQCPLYGHCTAPRPQGPFTMRNNSCTIPFKNVFPREATFHLAVDNPAFSVNATEKFPAKKASSINVSFKEQKNAPTSRRGRLTVTADQSIAPSTPSWTFYLQA